jgi:hypothetical protein
VEGREWRVESAGKCDIEAGRILAPTSSHTIG